MNNIYFDGAANTPLDPRVFDKMKPYFADSFVGNSFAIHDFGVQARMAVEDARSRIASVFHCQAEEVYFNSGATEGNNTIIQGIARINKSPLHRHKMVVSAIEHSSIISAIKYLDEEGDIRVSYIYPENDGIMYASNFINELDDDTSLVIVPVVNNELGTNYINIIQDIVTQAHKWGAYVLCDCTQAFSEGGIGKYMKGVLKDVDYITFSGHKIYGPTGTGVLIVRNGAPVPTLIYGGAQEEGHRGGTHNVAGIVGISYAVKYIEQESDKLHKHYRHLYDLFWMLMLKQVNTQNDCAGVFVTAASTTDYHKGCHYIINLKIRQSGLPEGFVFSDALINHGIACSAGSACDSNSTGIQDAKGSHVLLALGLTNAETNLCARISFTKYTTDKDIQELVKVINEIIKENRN